MTTIGGKLKIEQGTGSYYVVIKSPDAGLTQTYTGSGVYWANANVNKTSKTSSSISFRQNVHYWLSYNHWSQTMDIYYSTSNTKPSSPSHTYTSFVFNSTYYYFGLGAATGGSTDNHIIKSMNLIFTNAQNSTI